MNYIIAHWRDSRNGKWSPFCWPCYLGARTVEKDKFGDGLRGGWDWQESPGLLQEYEHSIVTELSQYLDDSMTQAELMSLTRRHQNSESGMNMTDLITVTLSGSGTWRWGFVLQTPVGPSQHGAENALSIPQPFRYRGRCRGSFSGKFLSAAPAVN